jgi:adenosylcobinamide-GDP ribazoletransferase
MGSSPRPFIFAWHFLTIIPLSRAHHEPTAPELASSMAWYPVVGLLIGGGLVMADKALGMVFDVAVVNGLLIVLLVLLTRGLHQDGLADTVDGLAGGQTPAERLSIMRDPHIGALGATGLVLSLILRYAGLMVILAWISPYARTDGGLAAPFLAHLSWRQAVLATVVLSCGLVAGFGVVAALFIVFGGGFVVLAARQAYLNWFGGVTGDTLGAANEVIEILFLLFIPLVLQLR